VDLTLKDVAAAMLGHLGIIGEVAVNGVDRPKSGNALYGAYGQDFLCKDGRRIMVIGLTDRQWRGLVKVTDSAEAMIGISRQTGLNLSQEGARWEARALITAALTPWFTARTLPEIAPLFEAEGLTWSEFRSFARAVQEDPDLQPGQNPMFADVDQPGIGRYPVPASPLTFSGAATPPPAPAPILGAHTEEVLADVAGLPSHEIAQLFDQGIVAGPR
jgi:2-methylfumaryl-CoA isomerase